MSQPARFQENLNLKSHGPFVSTVDVEELGIDPALLDRLVAAGPLCFLDFEATGLDPKEDTLIEAGAVIVREGQREAEIFNTFIHTDRVLSAFIRRLTGITQDDVAGAPDAREVAEALDEYIGEVPIVAHNARFESSWLVRAVSAAIHGTSVSRHRRAARRRLPRYSQPEARHVLPRTLRS